MTPVRLEPAALRSRVKHSTTEPLRSLIKIVIVLKLILISSDHVHKRTLNLSILHAFLLSADFFL